MLPYRMCWGAECGGGGVGSACEGPFDFLFEWGGRGRGKEEADVDEGFERGGKDYCSVEEVVLVLGL